MEKKQKKKATRSKQISQRTCIAEIEEDESDSDWGPCNLLCASNGIDSESNFVDLEEDQQRLFNEKESAYNEMISKMNGQIETMKRQIEIHQRL